MSKKKSKKRKEPKIVETRVLFVDGDKVKLNAERIRGHPDFNSLVFEYKHWVLSNVDTVFEITSEGNVFGLENMYLLKQGETICKWLIYSENLIKIDEKE
ncbi:MAG: hypothetical protein WCU80_08925 [Paludibacteraceae bacterium]